MSVDKLANAPREGEVIAGKYCVERVLGVGGVGIVVAAHHAQLDTKVAIKFLLPGMLENPEIVGRFAREARAAVRITSEHVARVLDVGTLENGAPYMVMEYLDGRDLAAVLQQRGPLPVEQAVEFVLQACVAVAEAHALGIVHRDLKPANLFCVKRTDGQLSIKVLDFGISKVLEATGQEASSFTRTNTMLGSPLYMSPEQMRGSKDVDTRADLWALGMILFELVAGRAAFQAGSVMELAIKVSSEAPPTIGSFRPDLPEGLEPVILKCLAKERDERFRNVAELAVALQPFAPARAKVLVDRISGILQSAGMSMSAIDVPPPPVARTRESARPALPAPPATSPATRLSGDTAQPVSNTRTSASTPGRSTFTAAAAGVAAACLFVLVAAFAVILLRRTRTETVAVVSVPSASTPTITAPGAVPAAPPIAAAPPPLEAVSSARSTPPEAGASRPPVRPAPRTTSSPQRSPAAIRSVTAPPAAPAALPPPPAPTTTCNPPTWTDDKGHLHLKPGCQ